MAGAEAATGAGAAAGAGGKPRAVGKGGVAVFLLNFLLF